MKPRHRSPSPLDAHLGYWLRCVSNHVSHAFKIKVERLGVTVAEWVVMRALFDEDGVRPSALAERVGLSRGAVSKLFDRLAAKELIVVEAHPRDGRAQAVSLSATGRALVPKLASLADKNDAEAFAPLGPRQRANLRALLTDLAAAHRLRGAPLD